MIGSFPRQILIVMVAGIGDLILGSMGFRALKNGHGQAEIHLLTSAEAAVLARHYPYVDRVWSFPVRRLRREKIATVDMLKTLMDMRHFRFDKIVNLYQVASFGGALKMGTVFSLLRSHRKIGHDRYGFGFFLDRKVPRDFFHGRHMADAMLDLACQAGGLPDGLGIEVFRSERVEPALRQMIDFGPSQSEAKTVAVNAGSDSERKRGSAELFSRAVNNLASTAPVRAIVLGGAGEEKISGEIFQDLRCPAINLAGKTTLENLVFVLEQVDLLITTDSGPMHIAAALKKPVVALFAGGYPDLFGPYGDQSRFRIIQLDPSKGFVGGSELAEEAENVSAVANELMYGL